LCGVPEYASAEILAFLDLAEKSLVSASRTALSPPEFPDGNRLARDATIHFELAIVDHH
jgi:hypothetical protein